MKEDRIICHGVIFVNADLFCEISGVPKDYFDCLYSEKTTAESILKQWRSRNDSESSEEESICLYYPDTVSLCKAFNIDETHFRRNREKHCVEKSIILCLTNTQDTPLRGDLKSTGKRLTKKKPTERFSAANHCATHGISYSRFLRLLRAGYSIDVATASCKDKVTYLDKEYSSRKALCEELGISYKQFLKQLGKGLTIDEAVDYLRNPKESPHYHGRAKSFFVDDVFYESMRDYSRRNNTSLSSLQYAIDTGKIKVKYILKN